MTQSENFDRAAPIGQNASIGLGLPAREFALGPTLGSAERTFQPQRSVSGFSAGFFSVNLSVFVYQTLLDKVAEEESKIKQVQFESSQKVAESSQKIAELERQLMEGKLAKGCCTDDVMQHWLDIAMPTSRGALILEITQRNWGIHNSAVGSTRRRKRQTAPDAVSGLSVSCCGSAQCSPSLSEVRSLR